MMQKPKPIEFSFKDREGLLERLKQSNMPAKDRELLTGLIEFNLWLQHSVEEKKITINKLQKMFGHSSEKRNKKKQQGASEEDNKTKDESISNGNDAAENPVDNTENEDTNSNPESVTEQTTNIRKYVPNTGRLGHEAYTGAEIIFLSATCKLGDPCSDPNCKGRLKMFEPGNIIKVVGQSFAQANKYVIETLRCGLCERYVKAKLPNNVCSEKYDPAFKAQLCVHKYFLGVPNYRLEAYQKMMGVPLPDSTQYDKIEDVANAGHAAFNCLEKLAANGHLAHGDDTTVRIKSVIKANTTENNKARTGTFTTGIISFKGKNKIHLFYSGRKHCGENMLALLEKRDPSLPEIKYMCDALSSNMPASLKAILINCLVHGRRNFVDIEKFYPEECSAVIDVIGTIYANDAEVHKQNLNDVERLEYHKKHSAKPMEDLQTRLKQQLDEHIVESNSPLGKAYTYMIKHWHKLTQFLRIAGAPLDNNTLEQALKIPIRVRKNSYFYATEHGATIGSLLQSLICTCIAAKQNPIHYLTALQEHKSTVRLNPSAWMPWNYKETLATISIAPQSVFAQAA
jgi:transposase